MCFFFSFADGSETDHIESDYAALKSNHEKKETEFI